MEFKLIESKEPFCGICFLNAGNKKTVCLDENHFNQNKLFFIFTLILFYENDEIFIEEAAEELLEDEGWTGECIRGDYDQLMEQVEEMDEIVMAAIQKSQANINH